VTTTPYEQLGAARAARDDARDQRRRTLFELQQTDEAIDAARRSADGTAVRRLAERRKGLEATLARLDDDVKRAVARARDLGLELLGRSPQQLIEQLDDRVPFLLLPLRLETRFAEQDGTRFLLLRIFVDDVAIAHHEKALTASELEAGKTYWAERCRANGEPDPAEKARIVEGAWNLLASRHGAYRASWIKLATQPDNFDDTLLDPTQAKWPDVETKPLAWSEVPRSFVLPDRFVVRLTAGGAHRDVLGNVIPDDLPFGPDPLHPDEGFARDEATGQLKIGDDLRWMVDFDRAVELGMALRIPLELPGEVNGFDTMTVLGLRLATSPEHNSALVARLIDAHRFSEGIAVLPQGTATNNTDGARSGLTTASESVDETYALEHAPPPAPAADHRAKSDGQRLAEALGVPFATVTPVPGNANRDGVEALAMNRALWSATMGSFLTKMFAPNEGGDLTEPLLDAPTIERMRNFFATYMTGRGFLPALRVGSQPYGVLTTSAISLWAWEESETGRDASFWNAFLARLRALEATWQGQVANVSFVGKAGDPFQHLLSIVGLQASSVQYFSRKAISRSYLANYLRFRNTPQAYATRAWEDMERAIGGNLAGMGLPNSNYVLRDLIFWRDHDQLAWPVVDDDPRVPFSETRPIRPFDGTHNYIDWLRTASLDDIRAQAFHAADGTDVPPPDALLYRMLRAAFLEELGRSGRLTVKLYAPEIFAALAEEPPVVNVGRTKTFTTTDVLSVDASRIGASPSRRTVADHLLVTVRNPAAGVAPPQEAADLADLHDALATLAPLPTARLERLFAEHVDLCGYRLDAWVQALFARRLLHLRAGEGDEQRAGRLHLGAFGYLEDVRPAPSTRVAVSSDELPEVLRPPAGVTVEEDAANGGYVHAPSLTHAVTAAVLRNAYLSHAEPARADLMAVNLTSSRVRSALAYVEGLRSGQELAAMLGYQFERGLHENHPGVELDQFIYVFRERFPLTSGKLTQVPSGTSAEEMEARNVVNGYELLEHTRTTSYPYGIAGLPAPQPAGTTAAAQAAAIEAEIDALADAMDSIADLVLSESVHQVVQGNYDRTRGILQSITEGQAPPEFDVTETPRSGRSLTFRLALPLDPTQTAGWTAASSPRAQTDAVLNHWLTTKLPAPADVQWQVTDRGNAPTFVSLASLDLEALDCVLMAGTQLGDLSSELERHLVYDFRVSNAVPDDVVTFFYTKSDATVPDAKALVIDPRRAASGKVALAWLFPLLKALREVVTKSRPLDARHLELPIESQQIDPANPRGFADGVADLKTRVEAAHADLTAAASALDDVLRLTITPLYDAWHADPNHVIVSAWTAALATLRASMVALSRFGFPEALPTAGLAVTDVAIEALVAQARKTSELAADRLARARTALDLAFTDPLPADPAEAARVRASRTDALVASYVAAAKAVLGAATNPLVLFRVPAAVRPEVAAAVAAPISADPLEIEEWAQSLVRVRGSMATVGVVMSYGDWLGGVAPTTLVPLQFPVRPGDAWIGTAYGDSLAPGDVASVVLLEPMPPLAATVCGLVIDDWTELVPAARETTGIAFHFNRPNSAAPQSLLLAVAPQLQGTWRWEDLVAVVLETFDRAKRRAVEPDLLMQTAYFQGLPTTLTEFSSIGLVSSVLAAKAAIATKFLVGSS
jgi:hypothetical protein